MSVWLQGRWVGQYLLACTLWGVWLAAAAQPLSPAGDPVAMVKQAEIFE